MQLKSLGKGLGVLALTGVKGVCEDRHTHTRPQCSVLGESLHFGLSTLVIKGATMQSRCSLLSLETRLPDSSPAIRAARFHSNKSP